MYEQHEAANDGVELALERQRPHVALEEVDLREAKPVGTTCAVPSAARPCRRRPPWPPGRDDVGGEEGHVPGTTADAGARIPGDSPAARKNRSVIGAATPPAAPGAVLLVRSAEDVGRWLRSWTTPKYLHGTPRVMLLARIV